MSLRANLHFDFIVLFLEYDIVRAHIFMKVFEVEETNFFSMKKKI